MAQSDIRGRALGAILTRAVLSWQTLVTLLITAILYVALPQPFDFWQPWMWLALGGLAELAFIVSAVTDPQAASEAVAREFEGKYDLDRIQSGVSRERVENAIQYRRSMMKLADQHSGSMRVSLLNTVQDIDDWIAQMYDLALHIDNFESNTLVERDRRAVPQQLEKARQRLSLEKDAEVRRDLQEQVSQLELQIRNLDATASSVKRAEIQLDSTLSSLGTIYAQMSLLGTKEVDSARAQRLRLEIKEEVSGLQDTIAALDEVQAQRLRLQ